MASASCASSCAGSGPSSGRGAQPRTKSEARVLYDLPEALSGDFQIAMCSAISTSPTGERFGTISKEPAGRWGRGRLEQVRDDAVEVVGLERGLRFGGEPERPEKLNSRERERESDESLELFLKRRRVPKTGLGLSRA